MKPKRGEAKYATFLAKLTARVGAISSPVSHAVAGFVITYNPADTVARIDGMRLRPRSGVVKTTGGQTVITFDNSGGITCDSSLAAPLLDAFEIPRDDQKEPS